MPKVKSRSVTAEVTLSIVAKINGDVKTDDYLKNGIDWIAEPLNADGCVVAVQVKSCVEKTSRVR